ncbi:MOSC domain-containing protein [Citricoccus sp. K5]|uniref:MOSC domain-containing protein n=1 Tax=Citricoccus sp. K5 TaxID=2653135 RepID=UPI0012F441DC|nr:MOSC domain-containing protein [Citricoccus sp. K5]VXB03273.1 MOSC domain-containing protein YiiM [Citricoccus sp. K5]
MPTGPRSPRHSSISSIPATSSTPTATSSTPTGTGASAPSGTITAVRVGHVRTVRWRDEEVPTGSFKEPVEGPVDLGLTGLAGDGQGDVVHHGGPEKALLCYGRAHYAAWQAEGLDLPEGALFENLTVDGLTESEVCLEDVWEVEGVRLQVTQSRRPCWKLSSRWGIPDLARRVQSTGRTGWYLRVLTPGTLQAGQVMRLAERTPGAVDLAELSRVMNVDKGDIQAIERILDSPGVPESWRSTLQRRLDVHRVRASGSDGRFTDEADTDRLRG